MITLTAEELRAQFLYDEATGVFTRHTRAPSEFKCERDCAAWNAKFSGRVAGTESEQGYRYIKINQKRYAEHRLVWLYVHGEFPNGEIDHINGVKGDNRISNLRDVSRLENCRNLALRSDNCSGQVGVSWNERLKKWVARIAIAGRHRTLGVFAELADAIAARKEAEICFGFHQNHGRAA